MLEIYMIRHGLAGRRLEDLTLDNERPLKKKGKEQMKGVAKGLKDLKVNFDVVLTSPILRARESAEILNDACGHTKDVIITKLLNPDASYSKLINYLNKLDSLKSVAIVGHEPFLSGFASYCLSKNKDMSINLKKGGVLKVETDRDIKPGQCILSWMVTPSVLSI